MTTTFKKNGDTVILDRLDRSTGGPMGFSIRVFRHGSENPSLFRSFCFDSMDDIVRAENWISYLLLAKGWAWMHSENSAADGPLYHVTNVLGVFRQDSKVLFLREVEGSALTQYYELVVLNSDTGTTRISSYSALSKQVLYEKTVAVLERVGDYELLIATEDFRYTCRSQGMDVLPYDEWTSLRNLDVGAWDFFDEFSALEITEHASRLLDHDLSAYAAAEAVDGATNRAAPRIERQGDRTLVFRNPDRRSHTATYIWSVGDSTNTVECYYDTETGVNHSDIRFPTARQRNGSLKFISAYYTAHGWEMSLREFRNNEWVEYNSAAHTNIRGVCYDSATGGILLLRRHARNERWSIIQPIDSQRSERIPVTLRNRPHPEDILRRTRQRFPEAQLMIASESLYNANCSRNQMTFTEGFDRIGRLSIIDHRRNPAVTIQTTSVDNIMQHAQAFTGECDLRVGITIDPATLAIESVRDSLEANQRATGRASRSVSRTLEQIVSEQVSQAAAANDTNPPTEATTDEPVTERRNIEKPTAMSYWKK